MAVGARSLMGARARCRWDNCFIRLLDGMLQVLGFADADGGDHALRIPVRIRHLEIGAPGGAAAPALRCDAQRALGRVATPLAAIQGLELAAAPRSAAPPTTKCGPPRERAGRDRRCGVLHHAHRVPTRPTRVQVGARRPYRRAQPAAATSSLHKHGRGTRERRGARARAGSRSSRWSGCRTA